MTYQIRAHHLRRLSQQKSPALLPAVRPSGTYDGKQFFFLLRGSQRNRGLDGFCMHLLLSRPAAREGPSTKPRDGDHAISGEPQPVCGGSKTRGREGG